MLTVKETLMFSALFRMPRTQSTAKKRARVMHLLDQLGLVQVADTIIGDEARRGVSGGERRRVSIGIDIIHDPLLLFLDEPTSGLDSTSAYMVVRLSVRPCTLFLLHSRASLSLSKYDCQFDFQNNFHYLKIFNAQNFMQIHYVSLFSFWVIS
jgi:ABC-type transport system involved in cytochrome bd biosynthesis fused ATPase/permease subunit